MNKTRCYVKKFCSHQVVVPLGRRGRYKTPEYHAYERQMVPGLILIPKLEDEVPVRVSLIFNVKGGVTLPIYKVVNKESGITWRNCDSLEAAEKIRKDKHAIRYVEAEIKYGVVPDWDNLSKVVLDILESRKRIPNDRFVTLGEVGFTFNNKENSIDIEIQRMEVDVDENNIYSFRRP